MEIVIVAYVVLYGLIACYVASFLAGLIVEGVLWLTRKITWLIAYAKWYAEPIEPTIGEAFYWRPETKGSNKGTVHRSKLASWLYGSTKEGS